MFSVFTNLLRFEFLVVFPRHLLTLFSTVDFRTAVECLWVILAYGCRNGTFKYSICIYSSQGA